MLKELRKLLIMYIIIFLGIQILRVIILKFVSFNLAGFYSKYHLGFFILFTVLFYFSQQIIKTISDEIENKKNKIKVLEEERSSLKIAKDKLDLLKRKYESEKEVYLDEENYFKTILGEVDRYICITDKNHEIIYANEKFREYNNICKNSYTESNVLFNSDMHIKIEKDLLNERIREVEYFEEDVIYNKYKTTIDEEDYIVSLGTNNLEKNKINQNLIKTETESRKINSEIQDLKLQMVSLLEFIPQIEDFEKIGLDELLIKIFRYIFNFVEEADYGSVHIFENGIVKYLDTVGHDLEKLNGFMISDLNYKDAYTPKPMVIENIIDTNSNEDFEKIKLASKPISRTLVFSIGNYNDAVGNITLDIEDGSDLKFSDRTIKMVESTSRMLNVIVSLIVSRDSEEWLVNDVLLALIKLMEIHTEDLYTHSVNVAKMSEAFVKEISPGEEDITYLSALVHDIGLILFDEFTFETYKTFESSRNHVDYAYEILKDIDGLEEIAKNVYHHHEEYDGSGYPSGIKGEEIPFISRVISIINEYDILVNIGEITKEDAIKSISQRKNLAFDGNIVEKFIKWVEENEE